MKIARLPMHSDCSMTFKKNFPNIPKRVARLRNPCNPSEPLIFRNLSACQNNRFKAPKAVKLF